MIVSGEGGLLVITNYEEINMDEGKISIQNGGSCRRFETAAKVQQMQFLKQ